MCCTRLLPLLLLAVLLLAGCRNSQHYTYRWPAGPVYSATRLDPGGRKLPAACSIATRATGRPINIDDDLTTEYLLYFTYDNGQMGAIIYDQQTGSTGRGERHAGAGPESTYRRVHTVPGRALVLAAH